MNDVDDNAAVPVYFHMTPDQMRLALSAFDAARVAGTLGKEAEQPLRELYTVFARLLEHASMDLSQGDQGHGANFDKAHDGV